MSNEKTQEKEVISLLNQGGELIKDFVKALTTFRVINGTYVKRFPVELFHKMRKEGTIIQKRVDGVHSVYKLSKK